MLWLQFQRQPVQPTGEGPLQLQQVHHYSPDHGVCHSDPGNVPAGFLEGKL